MIDKIKYLLTHNFLHSLNAFSNLIAARFRFTFSSLEPKMVEIEVTNECNMQCVYCTRTNHFLTGKKSLDTGVLKFDNFVKIINQFSYLDYVELQGLGEPLLNPELSKMIEYARKRNISVGIVTNASLLNEESCNNLVKAKLNNMTISLDSYRFGTLEKNKPAIKFANAMGNIKTAKNIADGMMKICFHLVITNENIDDLEEYIRMAHYLGIQRVSFTDQNLDMAGDNRKSLRIKEPEKLKAAIDKAIELSRKENIQFSYFKLDSDTWPSQETEHPCFSIWTFPYITWDGFVVPCCARPYPKEFNFGNVFETSFRKIWNSRQYREFRRLLKTGKAPKICTGCPHRISG